MPLQKIALNHVVVAASAGIRTTQIGNQVGLSPGIGEVVIIGGQVQLTVSVKSDDRVGTCRLRMTRTTIDEMIGALQQAKRGLPL